MASHADWIKNLVTYLTTFNTPFGRYCWMSMPFGICSAPEVWQQWMNQLIKGLPGTEVIADDFLAYGSGDTTEEARVNHDLNFREFLNRAREKESYKSETDNEMYISSIYWACTYRQRTSTRSRENYSGNQHVKAYQCQIIAGTFGHGAVSCQIPS